MIIKSIWLRRIHKWVGLFIGIQFLLWAISGTAMALLDMEEVAGGDRAEQSTPSLRATPVAWPRVQQALAGEAVAEVSLQPSPWGQNLLVTNANGQARLFNAATGLPVQIGDREARLVAASAHPQRAAVTRVALLTELTLAVREHELPIWQVDFRDDRLSSYYVSGTTGAVLERRNDTWRWWDFFWMLHNMDYADRSSFNHPLIISVGIAMAWLAVTGFWLLFRTMWRHDLRWAASAQRIRSERARP
ncbi:PepSY domain-containing protein [Sphingomonas kaistensis]|uniref:PepSY domain-containing protein n=1 Tax=Sphingomonas kaistensis TaxID=298708 RepID=A0ABZ2G2S7_9SPHN